MKTSLGGRTLIYPTPVLVVGTYDKEGRPNAMTAAWGGICCSRPPCLAIALRKATYTYGNVVARKAFTINIPSARQAAEVDYFGMVSGKERDKFAMTGLTAVKSDLVDAPYIKEFPLILECRLVQQLELGMHTQFIGEILDVKAEEQVLNEEGEPEIEKVNPLIYAPEANKYYAVGAFLGRAFSLGKKIEK